MIDRRFADALSTSNRRLRGRCEAWRCRAGESLKLMLEYPRDLGCPPSRFTDLSWRGSRSKQFAPLATFCILTTALLLGCRPTPVRVPAAALSTQLDELTEQAIVHQLDALEPDRRAPFRLVLDGNRAYWSQDAAYDDVRGKIAALGECSAALRIEIGRESGGKYGSLWFVETASGVHEFATGYDIQGVYQGMVTTEQWARLRAFAYRFASRDVSSVVSPASVDLPVYFVAGTVGNRRFGYLLYRVPTRIPQFELVARAMTISRGRRSPIELERLLEEHPNDDGESAVGVRRHRD